MEVRSLHWQLSFLRKTIHQYEHLRYSGFLGYRAGDNLPLAPPSGLGRDVDRHPGRGRPGARRSDSRRLITTETGSE